MLRPSKRKWILVAVGSAVFVTVGVAMFIIDGDWIGLLCAAFFGSCAAVSVLQLWKARLVLTSEGFTMDGGFKSRTYRWTDIEEFFPAQISTTTQVGWRFLPHYEESSTLRKLNESVAGVEASIGDTFGLGADDLADLMNEWRERYAPAARTRELEVEPAPIEDVFASAPGERRSNQYDQPPS